jgi:uncharacterized protein YjeT (DUF2065 family)
MFAHKKPPFPLGTKRRLPVRQPVTLSLQTLRDIGSFVINIGLLIDEINEP